MFKRSRQLLAFAALSLVGNYLAAALAFGAALLIAAFLSAVVELPWYLLPFFFLGVSLLAAGVAVIAINRLIPRSWLEHDASPGGIPSATESLPTATTARASVQAGGVFVDETVYLGALSPDGFIQGVTFQNCDIFGPAVLVMRGCTISGAGIDLAGRKSPFWEMEAHSPISTGAIEVHDSFFVNCRFWYVGFAASKEAVAEMRKGISMLGVVPWPGADSTSGVSPEPTNE